MLGSTPDLTLGDLLVEALSRLSLDAGERHTLLTRGGDASTSAVAALVEAKDRRRYAAAAEYAIAHAEAVALLQGGMAGRQAADDASARYPRHTACQRELARARERCPLLTVTKRR